MRGGVILIVVALLIAYAGVTGKYKCFTKAFDCLLGNDGDCPDCNKTASLTSSVGSGVGVFPSIAPLAPIRPISL